MFKKIFYSIFCLLVPLSLNACTDFLIPTALNNWINGRSLEFAQHLPTNVIVQARGEVIQSIAPKGAPGLKWRAKYGYVGVACITDDLIVDGMNEEGLSFGGLWLPTSVYQSVPENSSNQAIAIELIGKWILGNFSSVEEVKSALSSIYVWEGNPIPKVSIPPLHITLHDTKGNSLVIEFIEGKQIIYENPVKVLTNYPTFDWQLTNLENYTNLKALNSKALNFNGTQIEFKGQGSGMGGVPGDWTPASRFIRIFYFKYFARKPQTAAQGVNLALHLLNTVDIPLGTVKERIRGPQNLDFTQWVIVKDLSSKKVYIRSYQNQDIYTLDLNKVNLSPNTNYSPIPLNKEPSYQSLLP